jgi:hypothetical protein
MSARKQWNRARTVLAWRPGPRRNECNRIDAKCSFELSSRSAHGGAVRRCPFDSVKSHRIRCGWSSSRRLVGSKIHTGSVHDESRKNQSRCRPSFERAARIVGRAEFIAVGGAQVGLGTGVRHVPTRPPRTALGYLPLRRAVAVHRQHSSARDANGRRRCASDLLLEAIVRASVHRPR